MTSLLQKILNLASLPTDKHSERLSKSTFVMVHMLYILLSAASIGYHVFYKSIIGVTIYVVATIVGLFLIGLVISTKRFTLYINLALIHISVTHLTTRILYGGYTSGYMPWFVLVPLAATVLLSRWRAIAWWLFFVVGEFTFAALDPFLATNIPASNVSPVQNYAFSITLVVTVLVVVFGYLVRELELARKQADGLLLNILPEPIAEQLKQQSGTIAIEYDEITVLFADIVGFTSLSANADPVEIVSMLNAIFSEFDDLAAKHGLEKIKTIGDAYMVAGGVPIQRKDHAEAVADMALDMLKALKNYRTWNGQPIQVRIGINTGPAIAGVIGRRKFIYDLWGDVVNTASRMESNGMADVIQVTEATRNKLHHLYVFEEREPIEIKGKGKMVTYLLKTRNSLA